MTIINNEKAAYPFDCVFFRTDRVDCWFALNIGGVGKLDHHFQFPAALKKAVMDYALAQANLRIAEIQANATAKSFGEGEQ